METNTVHLGDNRKTLVGFEDNSIATIVNNQITNLVSA